MKNNFKFILAYSILVISIASCKNENKPVEDQTTLAKEPPREMYLNQIKKLEEEMHKSAQLNNVTGNLAIKAYSDYVLFFPNDTVAPDYLFKAAEIATATQQYPQALIYYQNITSKYPNYKLIQESLYLQGYLLDNFLNDEAKAKLIYEEVIQKYPASAYANDAKAAIKNLGKSDEELIKEFKKKNGEK